MSDSEESEVVDMSEHYSSDGECLEEEEEMEMEEEEEDQEERFRCTHRGCTVSFDSRKKLNQHVERHTGTRNC